LDIGFLRDVEVDNPKVIVIIIIVVVTMTGVLADTPTTDNGEIGWLTIDLGMKPKILFPV